MRKTEVVQLVRKKKRTLAWLTLNERNLFPDLKFSAISTIYVHSTCVAIDGYSHVYVYTRVHRQRDCTYMNARSLFSARSRKYF